MQSLKLKHIIKSNRNINRSIHKHTERGETLTIVAFGLLSKLSDVDEVLAFFGGSHFRSLKSKVVY